MNELLRVLSEIVDQIQGSADPWPPDEWEQVANQAQCLCEAETSPRTLGEALRLDEGLELPVEIVIAIYRRLMKLGVTDVRTRLCFARYLLLHGPEWDDEANSIVSEVEDLARSAGLWDSTHLGHHPVFFVGD